MRSQTNLTQAQTESFGALFGEALIDIGIRSVLALIANATRLGLSIPKKTRLCDLLAGKVNALPLETASRITNALENIATDMSMDYHERANIRALRALVTMRGAEVTTPTIERKLQEAFRDANVRQPERILHILRSFDLLTHCT
jgi:hypothetical protein